MNKQTIKNNLIHFILISLTIFIIAFIFHNSLQDSKTSNAISDSVAEVIRPILDPQEKVKEKTFHQFTRKLAHGIEFCALGCSGGGLMFTSRRKTVHGTQEGADSRRGISLSTALLFLLGTAVIDEYIQSFTGRTSSVKDILIDFGGGVTGLSLVSLAAWFLRLWRNRIPDLKDSEENSDNT